MSHIVSTELVVDFGRGRSGKLHVAVRGRTSEEIYDKIVLKARQELDELDCPDATFKITSQEIILTEVDERPKKKQCWGCIEDEDGNIQPNQLAHMGNGGCLAVSSSSGSTPLN